MDNNTASPSTGHERKSEKQEESREPENIIGSITDSFLSDKMAFVNKIDAMESDLACYNELGKGTELTSKCRS